MQQKLALFDFDGTVTHKDTLLEVIKFVKGKPAFYKGLILLSPVLVLYILKMIPNYVAKQRFLTHYLKGYPAEAFRSQCVAFQQEILPGLIRPAALAKIKEHLRQGYRVVIISASAENWIQDWCRSLGIEYIGTRLEIKDGLLTGKFEGRNCYGIEKVNRLKAIVQVTDYATIAAYGDSKGDREMLALATHPFYREF